MSSFVLLAALASTPATFAADPVYATPVFGTAYPLKPAADGTLGTRIAVTGEQGVDARTLAVSTMDVVSSANERHPSWTACLRAANDNNPNATPAIVVTACRELPPGVYAVTLSIVKTAGEPPQKLLLQVTRPAAELRPLTTQIVDRVDSLVREVTAAPASLILTETTGRIPLTGVTATTSENVTFENRPIGGTLTFTPAVTATAGPVAVPLTVGGDFPYGTAKTVVQVHANELAAPLYVAYEIRTRLHWWLLLPAILIGLLLGYLTRVVLKNFVEKRKVHVAALDLLDRIRTERRRRRDTIFAAAVTALEQNLDDALTRKTVTADSIKAVDDELAKAIADLEKRIADVRKAVSDASAIADAPGSYPPAIAAALVKARAAFSGALALVDSGDAAAAQDALDDASRDAAYDVDAAANEWAIAVDNALKTPMPPLPKPIDEAFASSSKKIADALAALPVGQQKPAAEILKAVHPAAYLVKNQFSPRVLDPLAGYAQRVIGVISRGAPHATPALAALRQAMDADADATLAEPLAAAAALLEALRRDITAVADAAQNDVSAQLAAGEYLEAARGAEEGEMQSKEADESLLLPGLSPAPPAIFLPGVIVPRSAAPYDPILIARRRGLREIAAAELARFGVAAIGITLAGLLFLLPTFDGTWRGVLTALLWGYAGDISIDALTDAARKHAPKT